MTSNINLANLTVVQGFQVYPAGRSNSGAGDINGDGFNDIIMGAPYESSNTGESYIIYGGTSIDSTINLFSLTRTQGLYLIGAPGSSYSGCSVSGAGDMNNDTYADIVIGALDANSAAGASYVVYGGASLDYMINITNMTANQGFFTFGAPAHSNSGNYVSSAGDLNKDGFADIIIGADNAPTLNGAGASYVIYGGLSFPFGVNLTNLEAQGFSIFGAGNSGASVSSAGDINGDGYDDIIIGAPNAPSVNSDEGVSYVIYGGSSLVDIKDLASLSVTQGFNITAPEKSQSGQVSGAGDVNGDGYSDVIIGAFGVNSYAGESYVIYGGPNIGRTINLSKLTAAQGFTISGSLAYSHSGESVSGAGDVNGDGYADVIIGAYNASEGAGAAYVIYGGSDIDSAINLANLTSAQGFSVTGVTNSNSGKTVSGAGDINGDGYDDIIISASATLISYVIYGAASGFATPSPTSQPSATPTAQPSADPTNQPSPIPSAQPTRYPSSQPSSKPSNQPTSQPTASPSNQPSAKPTNKPSSKPSSYPTQPTSHPSDKPSEQPTTQPTAQPSNQPSIKPSNQPTARPTSHPSQPTAQPSSKPSGQPSAKPSGSPSEQPTVIPSSQPSNQPSSKPSTQPSSKPTSIPTQPSLCPSAQPTSTPSGQPSSQPSQPSSEPSNQPSSEPSSQPSSQPTQPSSQPSSQPSTDPTNQPSAQPSGEPTNQPTSLPTNNPSSKPSVYPSAQPSANPSGQPTAQPTPSPTAQPSASPSLCPSGQPSTQPSEQPTGQPSTKPSESPSSPPSNKPTNQPSTKPTGQPTAQPTFYPTAQPSASPSLHPSSQPTTQPSGQPTSQPSTKPSESPSSQPSNKPTSQPSTQPTSQPTSVPSMSPTEPRVLVINENSNILSSIASGVASFIGAVILYFGPSIILSDWGYRYKAIYSDTDKENLKENEIGLYLDDGKLLALHKKNIYKIEINNGNNQGISEGLYTVITDKLNKKSCQYKYIYNDLEKQSLAENQIGIQYHESRYLPDLFSRNGKLVVYKKSIHSDLIEEHRIRIGNEQNSGISRGLFESIIKEYNILSTHLLLVPEENQLRDFLLIKERIYSNAYLPIYTDLGYLQGFIYTCCLMLKRYQRIQSNRISEESFSKVESVVQTNMGLSLRQESKDSNRERQISMKDLFQNSADIPYDLTRSSNPMLYLADNNNIRLSRQETETTSINQHQNFGIDSTNLAVRGSVVNVKEKNVGLLCIDASTELEYLKLQNQEFTRFGEHLKTAYKEISDTFIYKKNEEQKILKDSSENNNAVTIYQKSISTNEQFSVSNNLMISLFTFRQLVEYLPIIQYISQVAINYFSYNVTLPDVTDFKTLLITTHLALGNAAALLLPAESITNGMIVSTIDSSNYAMRLEAIDYLKNQEMTDNPVDLVKQCGATIAAYTLPNLATCVMTKLLLPEIPCAITRFDVLASGSLGAMQCYSNYKASIQPSALTTSDIIVPYIADAIAAFALNGYFGIDTSSSTALMLSIKNSMSIVAAVVAVDSISRIVMDIVPQEVKADYIEPIVDYAYSFASYGIDEINQIIGG